MQTITRVIEKNDLHIPPQAGALTDLLFLDLETTGLSAGKSQIYLIGCAFYSQDGRMPSSQESLPRLNTPGRSGFVLIQWLDETGEEEPQILEAFLAFSQHYRTLVHYNGDRFDVPFLLTRLAHYGLTSPLGRLKSIDLYRSAAPYRKLLNLPDLRQQTMERFLCTGRTEDKSGKEMIRSYREYLKTDSRDCLNEVLLHNAQDVEGLLSCTRLLALPALFTARMTVTRAQADQYQGFDGTLCNELLLTFRMEPGTDLTGLFRDSFVLSKESIFCRLDFADPDAITGLLKIPLYMEEMKYFYAGYKDYYYLPAEDQAIHKSIAAFVDPSRRRQASPENCYTRKKGSFLPQWDLFRTPFFKRNYHDPALFFELTEELKRDRDALSAYADYVFAHLQNS
ncbi:MAG: ribonuclease H-like domain-containing protein [Lachnospiraceae bacterium]|nr:ribonuclease H-like domain-containing protein [Lachnospiraceae bacterium]